MSTTRLKYVNLRTAAAWKFEPPMLGERLLPRPWLTQRLEQQLGRGRDRPGVFLLSAPPGFGKTTVIAQWAEHASVPVAWYHLEACDDDPVVFVRGLVRALATVLPRASWRVEEVVAHLHNGILAPTDVERVKLSLIDDLRRVVGRSVALTLTNVGVLGVGKPAHAILSALLLRQPDTLRLVIESREPPRLPLSPLYQDRRLDGIGSDELALRDEDVTALLKLHDIALSEQEVERLKRLCGGWVEGILLATDAGAPAFLAQPHLTELNGKAVFDYIAAHVLDVLPAPLLDFAPQVAVFETMTPTLCNQLLGIEDGRERLGALERRTGFMTRVGVGAGEPIYRFQPVLRQALLHRLKHSPGGVDRRRDLHARAGALLEAEEQYDQAVRHYAHAQRYERIVTLIDERRGALQRSGQGATLLRWAAMLPPEIREKQPQFQVLLAELFRSAGRTQRAWQAAQRACMRLLPEAERNPDLAARALIIRALLRQARGNQRAALRDADRALALASENADETRIQAQFVRFGSFSQQGDLAAAQTCLDEIEGPARRQRDLWMLARLFYFRSRLALGRGQYTAAMRAAETALRYAQEANDEVDGINSRLHLCLIKACLGQYVAARDDVDTAAEHARRAGYAIGRAYALSNLGDLERLQGNFVQAVSVYSRAIDMADRLGDANLRAQVEAWMGLALAQEGRLDEAVTLLRPIVEAEDRKVGKEWADAAAISLAIAYYRGQRYDRAEALLAGVRARRGTAPSIDRVRATFFLAATHLAQERLGEARLMLRETLEQVAAEDVIPVLLPNLRIVPDLRPLLEWMDDPRARSLARSFREVISVRAPSGTGRRPRADAPGDPTGAVRVFTFGGSRVFNGNDPVEHWRLPAAREMLCYMLDRNNEPVRKETLLDAIWPDKGEDLANLNFRQAVFQLKRVLGRPSMKKTQGRWHLSIECWADWHEFERLADEGERLAEQGKVSEAATALRQALTYCSGQYLEDVFNEWARPRREHFYLRRLTCLQRLADSEERLGRFDEAARRYFEVLEDPTPQEAAVRGLMRYFARRHEYGRAQEQFERLRSELGPEIAPSAETQALHRELMAKAEAAPQSTAAPRK